MSQVSGDDYEVEIARDLEEMKANKKAAKAAKRRFTIHDAPATIAAACIDLEQWPTKAQYSRWNSYLLGYADKGWWNATCPINDPYHQSKECTALINFRLGLFFCRFASEHQCYLGKSTTLTNAWASTMAELVTR